MNVRAEVITCSFVNSNKNMDHVAEQVVIEKGIPNDNHFYQNGCLPSQSVVRC